MPHMDEVVVVFTRSPELGATKTRLAEALGDVRTQRIARAMLWDTLELATRTAADVICSFDGDEAPMSEYSAFARVRFHRRDRRRRVGDGIAEAVAHAFRRGYSRVLLIPSDAPTLARQDLKRAIDAVEGAEHAALIPSLDGGIVGLALGSELPRAFAELRNSTPTYCREAAVLLIRDGRTVRLLEPRRDIDSIADARTAMRRLAPASRTRREVAGSAALPAPAPHTP